MDQKILSVPLFVDSEKHGKVICSHCGRLHGHGLGGGWRTSDCELTEAGSYVVFTVPGELPEEARQIDKQARRIQNILRDRKDRGGWFDSKWKRPTTAFLAEWEGLKHQAAAFNETILREANIMIFNGIEIRPEMTPDEAEAVTAAMKPGDAKKLGSDAAVILLVKSKAGECWRTENGDIDFRMPPPSPEEEAERKERSAIALHEYWKERGMM